MSSLSEAKREISFPEEREEERHKDAFRPFALIKIDSASHWTASFGLLLLWHFEFIIWSIFLILLARGQIEIARLYVPPHPHSSNKLVFTVFLAYKPHLKDHL
jgi:hypothetical protein